MSRLIRFLKCFLCQFSGHDWRMVAAWRAECAFCGVSVRTL